MCGYAGDSTFLGTTIPQIRNTLTYLIDQQAINRVGRNEVMCYPEVGILAIFSLFNDPGYENFPPFTKLMVEAVFPIARSMLRREAQIVKGLAEFGIGEGHFDSSVDLRTRCDFVCSRCRINTGNAYITLWDCDQQHDPPAGETETMWCVYCMDEGLQHAIAVGKKSKARRKKGKRSRGSRSGSDVKLADISGGRTDERPPIATLAASLHLRYRFMLPTLWDDLLVRFSPPPESSMDLSAAVTSIPTL